MKNCDWAGAAAKRAGPIALGRGGTGLAKPVRGLRGLRRARREIESQDAEVATAGHHTEPSGAFSSRPWADSCNVALSARKARFSVPSAYRKRRTDASFRHQWAAAVREGYAKLELMLLERAMKGTPKKVRLAGGDSGHTVVARASR